MDEHKKELGNNKESVIKFLDNVFSNAKVLRKARAGGIFVVVDNKNTDKAAIIKLYPSKYGDYYNVESAGYYRKDKWKESENVIAELSEPTQSVTASDVSKPQVPSKHGMELLNAKTTITSTHKDSERRENNKISLLNFSSEPNSILSRDTTNSQTSNNLQQKIAQATSPAQQDQPSEGQIGEANPPLPEGIGEVSRSDGGVNTTGAVGGNTTPPTQPSAMTGTTKPEQARQLHEHCWHYTTYQTP